MKVATACRHLLNEFKARPTIRAGSLITTVYGDAIAPRGGKVWLGSLIRAMAEFGIGERLVRTSVFRLAKDGWLQSEQIGRRSYYGLTTDGRARFDLATQRIYSSPASAWDGQWTLLVLSGLQTTQKEKLRRECSWMGFGALSANLLAHPSPTLADLEALLQRLDVADNVVLLTGETLRNEAGMQRLAAESWKLDELADQYAGFVKRFRPTLQILEKNAGIEPLTAFIVRTLLIQEYRKILLRDPLLPEQLLAADWPGASAYQLCRNLYIALHQAADEYVDVTFETAQGPLPPHSPAFMQRFGGLYPERIARVSNG